MFMTITSVVSTNYNINIIYNNNLRKLYDKLLRILMTQVQAQAVDVIKVKFFTIKAKRREETLGPFLRDFKADLPDDYIRGKPWN